MANSKFTQFMYTKHGKPTIIDCDIAIGASGAVGTVTGSGIKSVTLLTTGIYQVSFLESFNKYLASCFDIWSPTSGSAVAAGSLSVGTVYSIASVGTTTNAQWQTAGVPNGITPAVGVVFKCAATSSGTGTAIAVGVSGLIGIEMVGNPTTTTYVSNTQAPGLTLSNPYVVFQTLAATSSSTTTPVPTNPANGSTISATFYFSDASDAIINVG